MLIIDFLETRLTEIVWPKKKDDWKEKAWNATEALIGVRREKLALLWFTLLTIYFALHKLVPFASFLLCVTVPLYEYKQNVLNTQNADASQHKRLLAFWNLFALGTILDFTPVASLPLYYVFKTALFVYFALPSTDGANRLAEKLEPFFTSTSVPQTIVNNRNVDEVIDEVEEESSLD